MLRWLVPLSLLALLAGCGGSSDADPGPVPGALTLSGQVTFDFVPAVAGQGLVYSQTAARPARGVTVELLQNGSAIASTSTDAAGNYSFGNVAQNLDVSVRVRAEMLRVGAPRWNFRAVDNTNAEALYTLAGTVFNTGTANVTRNLHAASGWTGAAYTAPRSAAPFAILDVAYDAVQLLLTAEPLIALPGLEFHWSTANVAVGGSPTAGEIGGTRFVADIGILLVGAADQDTDEYDRHVIAHELGHYLEHHFSRSDSIGGPHAVTDQLDMRVAFGEAWGTAFAAMVTGDPVYIDTVGAGQHEAASMDVEQRPSRTNPNPGWFNEESLQSLLFDLYDSGRDVPPGSFIVDEVALGFAPIWAALKEQRTRRALTSVFPFVHELKRSRPGVETLIDNLTTSQRIARVDDDYGTGQTNFGLPTKRTPPEVLQDFNAVYNALAVGGTLQNVCSLDDYTSPLTGAENKLASRRFVRFTVTNPGTHTIRVQARAPLNAPADPDLVLHLGNGTLLRSEAPSNCSVATPEACVETFSPTLLVGEHILEVYEWTNTNSLDEPDAADRPIGRTCFDVTVTR